MTYWIIPSNNNLFRLDDLLKERNLITWRQNYKFEPSDIIFIYTSSPQSRISYQMEVIKVGIPPSQCDTNEAYWVNKAEYQKSFNKPRAKLNLKYKFPPLQSLSLTKLKEEGLKSNLQGGIKLSGHLLEYVLTSISNIVELEDVDINDMPDTIQDSEKFKEGSILQVKVNRYERSIMAREECIINKGTKCCVCGFDFGEKYGDIGKGFIHVHHTIPISEIGESYVIDPINDLEPVCPNCHSMLHRKSPPYTIEEMKKILLK